MKKYLTLFISLFLFLFAPNKSLFAQCINADFSSGTLAGWTGTWGFGTFCITQPIPNPYQNAGLNQGANNQAPNAPPQKNHFIMTGGFDPVLVPWGYNLPVVYPGNTYSGRIGNTHADGDGESISYSFLVTANNCNFIYHYAVVIEQATDLTHSTAGSQPYFNIKMVDGGNNPITCAAYEVDGSTAPGIGGFTLIPAAVTGIDPVLFKPWTSVFIPLNAYIGQTVTITFTTRSCYPCTLGICCGGSHFSYAYIAAECSPLQIVSSSPTVCGGQNVTLSGPIGAATYLWSGPGVQAPLDSATVVINQPGHYTLTMTTFGDNPCTFSIDTIVPPSPSNPSANFSATSACAGSPITFNDLSSPAGSLTNWAWDFNNDGITDTTGQNVTHTFALPGNYPVKLTVTWPPCTADTIITVVVTALPASTFTVTTPVCAGVNSVITYIGGAPANATYTWNFDGGTIVSGSGQGPYQISWATSGTKNVTLTVTQGSCSSVLTTMQVIVNAAPVVGVSPDVVICTGGNTTLTATGATTYIWAPTTGLNPTTGSPVTATPASTTTYAVTGTTAGCTDSASVTVFVAPLPTSSFTTTSPVCALANSTITYTGNAPANASYTWNFAGGTVVSGSGQGPYQVNWSTAGTPQITLTVTVGTCVSPVTTVPVTVNPSPTVSVSPDVSICVGGSTTLTAAGGTTYVWAPVTGLNPTTGATVTANPVNTTTYAVTGTTAGCSDSASVTVTVTPAVTVTVNSPSFCQGGNAVLTAVPTILGGTYSWAPGGNNTPSITVSPNANASYTVTYSTIACGTANATSTVTVNPLPAVALTVENPLCGANTTGVILVNASGGAAPYLYSLNGAVGQLPDSFTTLTPGFYSVAVQDANGCSNADTISILSSTPVSVTLAAASGACGGNNGQIIATATGGQAPYQYSLNAAAYQPSNTFSNLAPGFYTVLVADATGCTATDTTTLPQGVPISVTISSDSVKCFGGAEGTVTASATGGLPPYQYSLNGGAYQVSNSFTVIIGTYTITVKDQTGCTATTASVTVYQPTPLAFDSIITTAVKCPGDKNGTIRVYASGGTQPYNYSCTQDFVNFEYATGISIIGLDTGFYHVVLSDDNGCTLTDTARVPNAVPDFYTITTDTTSCYGSQYHDGAIHITGLPLRNAGFRYSIDGTNFQTTEFDSLTAGLYNITAQDTNGCTTDIANVVVPEPLQGYASVLPGDTTLKLGQSIQLATSFWPYPSSVVNSYGWTPLPGLSCIDCANPVLTSYARENTYTVTVTYNGRCTADASITVIVLDNPEVFIPNSFTPNGDGNNDLFLVYGENIKTIELKIFNRWGELVFETKNQFQGWDGTYKGQLQNPAVFSYETTITLLDDKQVFRKGTITLVR